MGMRLDDGTIERLRAMAPEQALAAARDAVFAAGAVGSEDFLDVLEQLVERGILSAEQLEQLERDF